MSALLLIFGLACLYFGGAYVVDGGVAVARLYHVPQAVIGLTLIAVGSSLPELATTIVASIRGQTSIAIGNLIGSNIFNILLVLGITATVHPLSVSPMVAGADIYLMLGAAVVVPLMLAARWRARARPGRVPGAGLSRLSGVRRLAAGFSYARPLRTCVMDRFELHARLAADTLPVTDWALSRVR